MITQDMFLTLNVTSNMHLETDLITHVYSVTNCNTYKLKLKQCMTTTNQQIKLTSDNHRIISRSNFPETPQRYLFT